MIHLLLGLGVAIVVPLFFAWPLRIPLWIGVPAGLAGGAALFVYLGRRVQQTLDGIFTRAGELARRQQFDPAIAVMKEGYRFTHRQFLVKSSIDGQIGVLQYVRKKHAEAEPLLRSASMHHYAAKAMLGVLLWKRGAVAEARKTFEMAVKAGRKESIIYAVYAYVLNELKERDKAIGVLNRGLKICKDDERLATQRNLLQNGKHMKMKVYGEQWYQFMLEQPVIRQEPPPFARVSKRALRG